MSSKAVVVALPKRRRVARRRPRVGPGRFRPMPVYTGKGTYRKAYPRKPRKASGSSVPYGSLIGTGLGTLVGGPVGGMIGGGIGTLAQGLVKHFTGFGDYSVEVNSVRDQAMGVFSPPELINKSERAFCLRHREFIQDIHASSAFTVTALDINPGLSQSFPWLAGVANNFEEYMIAGMVFEYKSLSADYTTAASAALGYVAMATQYNPLLPDFPDKIHLENYEFANSAKPSETFIHPIECKKSLNPVSQLYVRTGPVEAGADQRLYDLGKFQIATAGNSGTGIIGELWCTYEICFYKPKLIDNDDDVLSAHWTITGETSAGPLGTSQVADTDNTIDIVFTPNTMTFPDTLREGRFLLTWNVVGNSTATTCPTLSGTSNCALDLDWANHTVGQFNTQAGATATSMQLQAMVHVTGYSAVLTFGSAGTINASPVSCDLHLAQVFL